MRFLLLTAAAFTLAAPARAQVSVIPMVGYDIDYTALQLGAAVELGLTPRALPLRAHARPSAEYVFVDDGSVVRLNGDLTTSFTLGVTPFQPYAKVGLGVEFKNPDTGDSNSELGLNFGVGAAYDHLLAEVTFGTGSTSSARIGVGYRF